MHFKLIIVLLFSISVLNVGPGLSSQPFVKLQIKITRPPLENLMQVKKRKIMSYQDIWLEQHFLERKKKLQYNLTFIVQLVDFNERIL